MSYAVVLAELADLDADVLVAVYAAAQFRTAVDARGAVARAKGGVIADDADALAADRLRDALAHRGYDAHVLPLDTLQLAHPQRTKEIVVHGDPAFPETLRIDVADPLGRMQTQLPRNVAVLAAATTKIITTQAAPQQGPSAMNKAMSKAATVLLPGAQTVGKMVGIGKSTPALSTQSVEADEVYVDVVFIDDFDRVTRVRVDERGLILRAGGPRTLTEWAARLNAAVPASTTRQRGFVALAGGARPVALKNVREFDREVAACAWRYRMHRR